MKNALEIKNLTKRYNDFCLDNISFNLPTGCIMGFIGENGAGKSTTIKLILDLIKKDSGSINIFNKSLKENLDLKENIGVVMDEISFPENLSAKQINAIMKKCFKTWNERVYEKYINKFSLPIKKSMKEYSKGMKMKLSIAVALSHDSKLLILDEATSGLDPIVRDEILDVFLEFIQDENHSILISSHILSDLEKICDYITFIHKGKILFTQEKDELLDKYIIVKCSQDEYERLDKSAIIGTRKNSFAIEVLVIKDKLNLDLITQNASIEDIMLYYVKGDK